MITIHTIQDLRKQLTVFKKESLTIGFVPTMGALHAGHISLVERSVQENDITVVSIFVNPTQFNDENDLLKYPRTLKADSNLLEATGVSIIFAPENNEMYPEPDTRIFSFGTLDTVMEGKYRPGHFNGVAQIVSKLFDAVRPDRAYFGEKDFQQLAIIREMTKQLKYNIEIVGCPIIREIDGLAMSSRNTRLSPEERKIALKISQTLYKSINFASVNTVKDTIEFVKTEINDASGLQLEYFEIVDTETLQTINDWENTISAIGCIAVFCGEVRLIDNIRYSVLN